MTRQDDSPLVWRALADPARREILDRLRSGPMTTGALCECFATTRFATMKHLSVLNEAGLVLVRRRGRERLNFLNAGPLREVTQRWMSRFEANWADSLLRVKSLAEEGVREMADELTFRRIQIEQEHEIAAPREKVFHALLNQTEKWWAFRMKEGTSIRIEPRAAGRFYEEAPDGSCFLWGMVYNIVPPQTIKLIEPYANVKPGVEGCYTFQLEEANGGKATTLKFSYMATGDVDDEMQRCTSEGWELLLGKHLREWVEQGVGCEVMVM